jgi:hypothetical protein
MGSAHGAYSTLMWTVEPGGFCTETQKTKSVRLKNWYECERITNDQLNPDGSDSSCNPQKSCYG